jgi:anaerobic magnesium-protoporphyrin IX monomethyl ester cyclase
MKVLLINPFYPLTEMPSPPLGLAYVASAFEQAGASVRILDLVVEPYSKENLQQLLAAFQPDLVGATSVTMTFDAAMSVLRDVKELRPAVTTLMGGPHVSFHARETLLRNPELDICVLGEGEATVAELVGQLNSGGDLHSVAGLALRQVGDILMTQARPPGFDVKNLPLPARHLLPLGRYRALGLAISMITSRGCPFQCIFCVGRKMSGAKVRYRDPVSVVDEMEYLHALGFYQINIADDLFTAKKSHCFAVCEEIIRRNLEVKWTAFSRANTINRPLLAKLKQAGCVQLSFGFESANEEILKTVQKRINQQQMLDAAEMCRAEGMPAQASFIYGLPGETLETLQETVEFGEKINSLGTTYGIHLLAPFPGTAVRDQAEQYGLKILTDDWSQYSANSAIVETLHVNAEQLERTPREIDEIAVQQVAAIQERLKLGTASEEEKNNMAKLERMDIFYQMMMHDLIAGSENEACVAGDQKDIVDQVVNTAAQYISYSSDKLRNAISFGFQNNMLAYNQTDQDCRLSWVEPGV